jgi:hypothetical protein
MAEQISLSDLITIRDNLVTAYNAIGSSPTKAYMLGDRQFTYEDRDKLWAEIRLRSTTYKALGKNRMDFRAWA